MMKNRVVDIGKKQFRAKESYAKDVLPKAEESLKKEDEKIALQLSENEKRHHEDISKAEKIKLEHLEQLKEFREKDQIIKEDLRCQVKNEKLELFEKQQRDLAEHLRRTRSTMSRIQNKKTQLIDFWDKQSAELIQQRRDWTQMKADCAQKKTQQELDLERSFYHDLDQIEMEQLERGRNVIPLKKVRQNMTLYQDPVIEALDSSGICLRNNFHGKNLLEKYSPHKARERLSLNWNE
ncbi:uncharacterized protein LOC131881965 isoform X1 [Tigriopus californicus]|uniref:uncharacterized protein LOC131881965 isoform X1 n=1 Tax=Tigriopus californicus TaxID=6832 RepID=UPI0027DA1598|nr:uncharacterized protein LOC131881965 isoform X1 [Tigriopus californicus]